MKINDRYNWDCFLIMADQFIISYATSSFWLNQVPHFLIWHAVELYLKAAYAKLTGDVEWAIKKGHKLKTIWDKCKKLDPNFMHEYDLRNSVLNVLFVGDYYNPQDYFSDNNDRLNYQENQELYNIFKLLPDLKYMHMPMRSAPNGFTLMYVKLNPYRPKFFKRMREYLGHPLPNNGDFIKMAVEGWHVPQVKEYLTQFYSS